MNNIESKPVGSKYRCPTCTAKGYDWDGNGCQDYDDGHTFCFKCRTRTTKDYDENNAEKGWSSPMVVTQQQNEFIGEVSAIPERGISKEICEKLGILTGSIYGKSAYGFELDRAFKTRLIEEKKFTWHDGDQKDCEMFGLAQATDYNKPIIITEGEFDTAACYEAGHQACSIKSGAAEGAAGGSTVQSITHDLDKLVKYPEIWLGLDNDGVGKEATNAAIAVLPVEKIRLIDWKLYKDANEALIADKTFGVESHLKCILSVEPDQWKPEGVVFGDEVNWEEVWEPRAEGLKLPWQGLQDKIKGLHKGRLYLFGGGASIGKSSVLRELTYHLRTEYPDLKVAHLFLEEDTEAGPLTYLALHKNIPLGDLLENKDLIPKSERQELQKLLNKNTMFTTGQYELGSEELLIQLEWLAKVKNYDIIVLDHISMVAEASNSKESERICINQLMLKLRSLVRRTGLTVIAACHLSNPDMGKDWEEGREVKQKDFHGSSALRKVPDVMIGVERNMRDKYNCDQLVLRVIKNRWFSKVGIADTLTYITSTGRLK